MIDDSKFKKALKYESIGDYNRALRMYFEILQNDKFNRSALLNIGSIYYRLNELNKALEFYNKALKIKTDYIAFFNIGSVYFKQGNYKRAIIALDRAYRLNPNEKLSLILKGIAFSKINENENALSCFEEVLTYDPINKISLWAIIVLLNDMKNYKTAYEYLNIYEKNYGKLDSSFSTNIIINCMDNNDVSVDMILQRDGFKNFDTYISNVSFDIEKLNGNINDKIKNLEEEVKQNSDKDKLIALSLCHLFKGDRKKAIEYLLMAKNY